MKFPYHVFHNNVSYAPFEEVPIEDDNRQVEREESPLNIVDTVEEIKPEPIKEVKAETKTYNRTEINRMPSDELRAFAKKNGIKKYDSKKCSELKSELIALLGV